MLYRDVDAKNVEPVKEGDVAGAVEMLRSATLHDLRDERFLRQELLLALGLNGEALDEFPEKLYPWCGSGVRSWQYPTQFSKYLCFLSTRNIQSYVEIGCRFGGTFIVVVEYLRRFGNMYKAVALDIEETEIMRRYSSFTSDVKYHVLNSQSAEAKAFLGSTTWDLAFVDGDHSYEGCLSDYMAVRNNARMIGIHDIASTVCPGVCQVWAEIRNVVPASRIFQSTEQYADVRERTNASFLGIGVVDFT